MNLGDGDLHTVCEDPLGSMKYFQMELMPDTDIRSILRDRFEIEDDVSQALSSSISSVLACDGSGGVVMSLRIKVVQESVFTPEDYDDNDDDDDGENGLTPCDDLCEDHEMSDSDIIVDDGDDDDDEEGEYIHRETRARQDVSNDLAPFDLREDSDLPEISDSDIDLEEDGMGMADLAMDEVEEGEYIPRETGAPEDVLRRLKQEGETQARSLKKNIGSADCVVCMEQFSDSDMVININMPCSHVFHQGCIFEWLQMRNTCPLCRRVPYEPLGSGGPEPVPPKL